MVDGEDQVLLEGPGVRSRWHAPGHGVQVGGRMAERRISHGRTRAGPSVMERGEHRRHGGRDRPRLRAASLGVEVEQRRRTELGTGGREHGAQLGEGRRARTGDRLHERSESTGNDPACSDLRLEPLALAAIGQPPTIEQEPDVLQPDGACELGRVVLAVVVEALVAMDVTDLGGGDRDVVETGWDVDEIVHATSVRCEMTLINVDPINVDAVKSAHHDRGMTTYVGATEAARLLGVTKPTLYAYVSRGLVTRRSAADGRTSLYARDEVEALATRHLRRTQPAEPTIDIVIRSSITSIDDESVHYRGHDAAELSRSHGFEGVAELLWTGELPAAAAWSALPDDRVRAAATADSLPPVAALAVAATLLDDGGTDGASYARRLLAIAPTVLGGPARGSIARRLAAASRRSPDPALVAAVDRALVLLADHELATSTLTVRNACSVRASPAHAIAAGLHVVSGALHGGASREVVELLTAAEGDGAREAVTAVLRAGRRLPGFGHAVYRTADPRLAPLLEAVRAIPDRHGRIDVIDAVLAEAGRVLGKVPNVDLALGALLFVGELPPDTPIFAVARIAGWAAHYDEEAQERPGRYRGITRPR